MVDGTGAAGGGIVITIAAGGMPTRGGFIQYHGDTDAATTGTANAAAVGAEAGIIAAACDITAVGPDTRM